MSFIDIFSWFVLIIVIASIMGIFVFMWLWPIKVTKKGKPAQVSHKVIIRHAAILNYIIPF